MKTEPRRRKEKKERQKEVKTKPRREKKKKKKKKVDWSKGVAELWIVGSHVCLITKILLSYELWKLKTVKMYF